MFSGIGCEDLTDTKQLRILSHYIPKDVNGYISFVFRDSRMKGGFVGMTLNKGAMRR